MYESGEVTRLSSQYFFDLKFTDQKVVFFGYLKSGKPQLSFQSSYELVFIFGWWEAKCIYYDSPNVLNKNLSDFFLISKSCRNKSNEASGILGLFCVTAITKTVSFFAFLSFLLNNF